MGFLNDVRITASENVDTVASEIFYDKGFDYNAKGVVEDKTNVKIHLTVKDCLIPADNFDETLVYGHLFIVDAVLNKDNIPGERRIYSGLNG